MQEHALDVARLDTKHATLEPQGVPQGPAGLRRDQVEADGLQDLPHPQGLPGCKHLCQGLWKAGEAEVCQELQEGWRLLQVLHQKRRCLLPWVQVLSSSTPPKKSTNHIQVLLHTGHVYISHPPLRAGPPIKTVFPICSVQPEHQTEKLSNTLLAAYAALYFTPPRDFHPSTYSLGCDICLRCRFYSYRI